MDRALVIALFGIVSLAVALFIGLYYARIQRGLASYFLAERSIGPFVMGISLSATYVSGWTFVGGPGLTYSFGLAYLFAGMLSALFPGMLFSWFLNARKFRVMAETHHCMTNPDVALARYESKAVSGLCALAVFVGCIFYMTAQVMSLGYIISVIFNVDFNWGVTIGMVVLGVYTIAGGIQGAILADVFQGMLMILTSLWIAVASFVIVGGPGAVFEGMKTLNPQLGHPQGAWTTLFHLGYFGSVVLGIFNWPHATSRYLMIRRLSDFRWVPFLNQVFAMSEALVARTVGLAYLGLLAMAAPGAPKLTAGDQALPTFLLGFMPASVAGIVLAGTVSAILSTGSGFINTGGAAFTRDFLMQGLGFRPRNEVLWGRIGSLVVTIFAVAMSYTAREYITLMGVAASGIWASTLVPVITLGLNWRGASKQGALASIIFGLIAAPGLQAGQIYKLWSLPAGMQAGGIVAPISILIFFVVSRLTNPRKEIPASMEPIMRMPLFTRVPAKEPLARPAPAGGADEEKAS